MRSQNHSTSAWVVSEVTCKRMTSGMVCLAVAPFFSLSPSFFLNICEALSKLREDANIIRERERLYFAKELNNY